MEKMCKELLGSKTGFVFIVCSAFCHLLYGRIKGY